MTVPFYGKEFTFIQPDGSKIKVKGWGDQHHAVFETLDGYTIVRDPDSGTFNYAELTADKNNLKPTGVKVGTMDPAGLGLKKNIRINPSSAKTMAMASYDQMGGKRRWEVRRERRKTALRAMMMAGGPFAAPPRREIRGDYLGLCLLIQFPDVEGTINTSEVTDFCNNTGYNGYGNNGSVYDYFYENSNGNLKYKNIIAPYYTAQKQRSYYASIEVSHGIRARELIKEALSDLINQGFDFYQLSVDDEGYVYALNVFYAGYCPNNWGYGLWPHSWCLDSPFELAPGRIAFDYQITDMGGELCLATFCHENGHMVCDFPDLYDYGYESRGVGQFCLMCSGGRDEKNPANICGYLKYKAGWAKSLRQISHDASETIASGENDFFIHPKSNTEYFIIENRSRKGRDSSIPATGLAIWHVDELGSNNYEDMTESRHYECSLEQADNRFDLEHGSNIGDSADLFNATVNPRFADATDPDSKWWNRSISNLDIFEISDAADTMSFRSRLRDDGNDFQSLTKSSSPRKDIPDNDTLGIQDVIEFEETATIASIDVTVDISHSFIGDIVVTLKAPSGVSVCLHNREGGHTNNLKTTYDVTSKPELSSLVGEPLQGNWTLIVQDLASADQGKLNKWELTIKGKIEEIVELEESPGLTIPDDDPSGIERTLSTDVSGQVKDIEVSVDITHTYIQDLVVKLSSPSGINIDLHNRIGGAADNIIKTYTPATVPGMDALLGEPTQGEWKLQIADLAGQDIGKLNHWSLRIYLRE